MTNDLMRQVTDPAHRHDPYPIYAELRRTRVNQLPDGSYALGRYHDVVALLHDPRISSVSHDAAVPTGAAPSIQRFYERVFQAPGRVEENGKGAAAFIEAGSIHRCSTNLPSQTSILQG